MTSDLPTLRAIKDAAEIERFAASATAAERRPRRSSRFDSPERSET
jgi:hypothetical protein